MDNLQTIGNLIKSARQKSELSVEELAERTKINLKLLKHLENDELNNLPKKIYVVGFVKSLAKTLSLDINESLEFLNYTYEQKLIGHSVQTDEELDQQSEKIDLEDNANAILKTYFNKKIALVIVLLVVIFLVSKLIYGFISRVSKESKNYDKQEVTKVITKEDIKEKDSNLFDLKIPEKINLKDKSDVIIKESPTTESSPTEIVSKKKESTIEPPIKEIEEVEENLKPKSDKFPYIRFYQAPTNLYRVITDSPEADNTEIIPTKFKDDIIEGLQNVFIHATEGDSWISFKVDDEKIKRYVLKKGNKTLLRGERVLLFMGNIKAATIFLNNQLLETESRTGVKSLIFPQEAASDYEFPLFPSYKYVPYTSKSYKEKMDEAPQN